MYRPTPAGNDSLEVAEGSAAGRGAVLEEGLALGEALAGAEGSTIGSAAAELAQKEAATTVSDTRAAEMPLAVRFRMPLPVLTL
jgi:hypothetical protein